MRYLNCLIVTITAVFSLSVWADELPTQQHISVTGTATLNVKPDQVLIKFQATALESTGEVAKQKVDRQVSDLLVNLQKDGFKKSSLESATLYTKVEYDYQKDKRLLLGVRATRDLSYLLTDINKVNQFLDLVLAKEEALSTESSTAI